MRFGRADFVIRTACAEPDPEAEQRPKRQRSDGGEQATPVAVPRSFVNHRATTAATGI